MLLALAVVFVVAVSPGILTGTLDIYESVQGVLMRGGAGGDVSAVRASDSTNLFGWFAKLGDIVGAARRLRDSVGILVDNGAELALTGRGEELIAVLKNIRESLAALNTAGLDITRFSSTRSQLGDTSSLVDGLSALINFLDVPQERRIALLFQNQSEIRPAGGFVGSYAEVVLDKGAVESIKVDDIYYPDRRLPLKIIPPRELQSITGGWGARDAGWFLDFPTSAEKTLEFLDASDVYAPRGVTFDGAIAINARVVEDFLAITGPVELPEYGVTLTKDNFLFEVREEVEASREKDPTQNPKKILAAVMPVILERLNSADSDQKRALMLALLARVAAKDIQMYFRDDGMQQFAEQLGAAGRVYTLSPDFVGDYLSVVNANVAGGKSDIFIDQTISLSSVIGGDGKVTNELTITRRHFGENESEPLYRARNQNFIRVYAVPGAVLESVSGVTPKEVKPLVDYKAGTYREDPVLAGIEATREETGIPDVVSFFESGKRVFANWFSTDAGETRTLVLRYTGMTIPLRDTTRFRFVFEKQSGVESHLRYTLTAPPGFYFKENGAPVYTQSSDSQPARIVVDLTLVRA